MLSKVSGCLMIFHEIALAESCGLPPPVRSPPAKADESHKILHDSEIPRQLCLEGVNEVARKQAKLRCSIMSAQVRVGFMITKGNMGTVSAYSSTVQYRSTSLSQLHVS